MKIAGGLRTRSRATSYGNRAQRLANCAIRARLDAALKDVDAVFYIEPAFLANEAKIGNSMVDGAKRAGMCGRNSSADEGKRWGRIAGELCCISLVQTVEAAEQKEPYDKCPIFLSRSY